MRNDFIGNIKMDGHRGTWYSLGARTYFINGANVEVHLMEHERYGDEAACVIGTLEGVVYMENVWNGWDDWKEYFLEEQGYNRSYFPLVWEGTISI